MKKNMKILIVDDDSINLGLLSAFFSAYQCDVYKASNGCQALDLLKTINFDLVLTDLQMGCISGLEVVREAKYAGNAVIFLLTGCRDVQCERAAIDSGADEFLHKPFSMRELLARILRHGIRLEKKYSSTSTLIRQSRCRDSLQSVKHIVYSRNSSIS